MRQAKTLSSGTAGERPTANSGFRSPSRFFGGAMLSMLTGMALLSGCQSTPSPFFLVQESKYQDVDRTCKTIELELKKRGFNCKGVLNLTESMAKHGVTLEREVRVVQFGRSDYARDMVMASGEVSALMPCTFGVYVDGHGHVLVVTVNRNSVGEMFGGTVADRMRIVSGDLADILESVSVPATYSQRRGSESICRGEPWCQVYIGEYGKR